MALLSVQNVSVSFGERDVLRNISFDIAKGDRVGLIGSNGCGKTTLFNAITGKLEVTEGAVVRASGTVIGCVEQHACADSARTVYDELLTVFAFLEQTEKELEEIHRKVELTDGSVPEYIEKQSELTDFYQANGGLTYRARAHSCLKGLGFSPAEEELPVLALSGGQRTKLSLGKLLLSEPDLMLLDEPTNHLDTVSVEWLEDFLSKFGGSLIPAGTKNVIVTMAGAVDETPTQPDGDGSGSGTGTKVSFWEMILRFFRKLFSIFKKK